MGKYFKYAIGEIVLVVIGILIALQINIWNEYRKERQEERQVLLNIKIEYENAVSELSELIAIREQQEESIMALYEIIETGSTELTEAQLLKHIFMAELALTYNSQTNSLDMLINTGKINILTNEGLRVKLISWPTLVDDYTEEENTILETTRGFILPVLGKYISIAKFIRSSDIRTYPFSKIPTGGITNNFDALFKDADFENYMTYKYLYTIQCIEDGKRLIAIANSIIDSINQELKE